VARSTVYHAIELDRLISQAIEKKGFSVVEAVSYCHTTYGRFNRLGKPVDMMRYLKENSVKVRDPAEREQKEQEGKIVRGVFLDRDIPEYTELYEQVIERAQAA
jgi:2-oxoglutarate ferredoxin oxidoreductase subunit beta